MDQSEELGHVAPPVGSVLSDLSVIPSGVSDYPSYDMDITVHPSESESHSSLPTMSQGTGLRHSDQHDSPWGAEEDEVTMHRRLYPKTRPYLPYEVGNGYFEGEDYMDPAEMVTPARRVGRPNLDGSIDGSKGYALPPARPDRTYSHFERIWSEG